MTTAVLCLLGTILTTAGGQFFYKLYFIARRRAYLGAAVVAFVALPFLSFGALRGIPLDVVYMTTALTIVIVTTASILKLKEPLTRTQLMGSALVVLGVLLYNT